MVKNREDDAFCNCTIIHEDVLNKVQDKMTSEGHLFRMAELFKALDDPTRLKIVNALIISEMCVCDIAALLNLTQPAVSHHLKMLRQIQLIKYRREGKVSYYSLDDEHIEILFKQGLEHVLKM